jgi:hypothetical protein
MLEEFEKIIDVEAIKKFIEGKFGSANNSEEAIEALKSLKIMEFLKNAFKPEFSLQSLWYEQEVSQIKRKLERCVTLDQKKNYLQSKLEEQEILFEEHEYFDFIEEFAESPLSDLIGKIQKMKNGFEKTSRWMDMDEEEQSYMSILSEIPDEMPSDDVFQSLTLQKIRMAIITKPSFYKIFTKVMSFKRGKVPISKFVLDIIKDIFDVYFQSKINTLVREEYQKLIPKSDYELAEVIESYNEVSLPQIEWQGTQKELAELFVELRKKGWITAIPTKLIKQYFTNSYSIEQVLKPNQDPKTKDNTYEGIYTSAYKPYFDSIRQNT